MVFFLHGFLVLTFVFLEFMASRADIPLVFCGKFRAFLVHSKEFQSISNRLGRF